MTEAAATLQTIEQQLHQLLNDGKPKEAECIARSILASGSGPITIWKQLATALRNQGRYAEARDIQAMIVDNLPGDLSTRFDLAETLLMLGDFERGWREYHYRYSLPHTTRIERKVQKPRWDGPNIAGQTLLIHDEQGFGDTFEFLRMMPWAKARSGAKIILEIAPETLPFAKRMDCIDLIIPRGTLPPHFDVHCEMMSLPMAMRLKPSDIPGKVPYLTVDEARLTKWCARLADLPRPLVCLVWGGRPTPNPHRSMPLSTLAPLAMGGVTFLSLQKGPYVADAKTPPEGMHLIDLGDEIADFDDTAAILSIADLLISIDSAPVHLAGALNRPTWVMLLETADWRWHQSGEQSLWYPSLRLFRQPAWRDWGSVVNKVAKELAEWRDNKK